MALEAGTKLGHYEVVSSLGVGGMGEVYRARDTKLGREVAIKVLPEGFSDEPERMARFEREAKVLAGLNHPNIATLHAFEADEGMHFLVMEVVEGETLADRIKRGAIPVDEALPLFLQIAEGLEAAHEKGVIHRDLKPANIKVTDGGQVKILDFGLAKAMAPKVEVGDPAISQSPTLTLAATERGEILGTAAYMSPEQAKGREVDKRTDIWAFGACLFEALTGRRAFGGGDAPETLASVLKDELSVDSLPDGVPIPIRRLLRRCLAKEPKGRLQDIGDARLEIEEAVLDPGPESIGAGPASRWGLAALAIALLIGAAFGGLVVWSVLADRGSATASAASTRSPLAWATEPLARRDERETRFAVLSPDGSKIVFRDRGQLWLRRTDELESRPLPGTERATSPFFSPDSQSIAFFTAREIKRLLLTGGTPQTIAQLSSGLTGAWGADGTIVFGIGGPTGLWRVAASGGVPGPWTELEPGQMDHDWPQILPDGDSVLYVIAPANYEFNSGTIVVQSLRTEERKTLIEGGTYPRYSPSGHLLFARSGLLMAAPFDLATLEITGPAAAVVESLEEHAFISGVAEYSVSDTGHLLYARGDFRFPRTTPVWVDRVGQKTAALPLGRYQHPVVSPDGSRIAVVLREEGMGDLYVHDLDAGTRQRLTFEQAGLDSPRWSDDGETIFFSSGAASSSDRILSRRADGTGATSEVAEAGLIALSLSPSGDAILGVTTNNPGTGWDIVVVEPESGGPPRPLIATPAREEFPELSPDGRWIAYQSDVSGETHVYVQPYPDVDGGKWQVSEQSESGMHPTWNPRGGEILYREGSALVSVTVTSETPFEVGNPVKLFDGPYDRSWWGSRAISPDGQRFLMLEKDPDEEVELILVHNWFEELKRLVPTD